MQDYLNPCLTQELREISAQGLAHVGDAVFELMVRTYMCMEGKQPVNMLHSRTVGYVSAKGQALASEAIMPLLNEDELAVYKRGRNAHTRSTPKSSTNEEYRASTGLEALFGYLYLSGEQERLGELFAAIVNKSLFIPEEN